jgi:hypothetical protein
MLANQVTFVIAKPWSKQPDLRAPAGQSHLRHSGTDPAAAERQSRLVAGDDRFAARKHVGQDRDGERRASLVPMEVLKMAWRTLGKLQHAGLITIGAADHTMADPTRIATAPEVTTD